MYTRIRQFVYYEDYYRGLFTYTIWGFLIIFIVS